MFIRFFSGEIQEDSRVSEGLFWAAYRLLEETRLPDYEHEALRELMNWFDKHLASPYDYRLRPADLAERSLCWFRASAQEHLQRAWEIVTILQNHDIYVWTIKLAEPGYVIYEDEVQVLAFPYDDLRRRLKRRQ